MIASPSVPTTMTSEPGEDLKSQFASTAAGVQSFASRWGILKRHVYGL